MSKSVIVIVTVFFVLVGCQGELGPEDVVSLSIDAINEGDFEEAISYYTDDAEAKFIPVNLLSSSETYQGKEDLTGMFEEMATRNTLREVDVQTAQGALVITTAKISNDLTNELGIDPLEYGQLYTFQDGKIKSIVSTLDHDSLIDYLQAVPLEFESLLGRWGAQGVGYVRLDEDHTYRIAPRLADLDAEGRDSGNFSVEGSSVIFKSGEATNSCQSGDEGNHLVKVVEDDRLLWLTMEEQCEFRYLDSLVELTKFEGDS